MTLAAALKYILVLTSLLFFSALGTAKEMRVVVSDNYLPFSWQEDKQVKGILKDFLDEIVVQRMGIKVSYEICPWARCQIMVKEGQRDAFFTISSAERDRYSIKTELPLFISDFYIYSGANNKNLPLLLKVKNLDSLLALKNLRYVYLLGAGWHRQNLSTVHNVTTVLYSTKILELLKFNRADVYIEQAALMNYQIKRFNLEQDIIQIPALMDHTNWHLYISNKSDFITILPQLDQLLNKMHQEGSLQKLRHKIFSKYQ
ncbi:substrate-binding periplasmic protein [Psychromonas aquimarina]|uniref:substrate-binding periplasmic protein n=1 Tax=Psychromonas aquimarina TaxID=444919 RepID=UPI00041AF4C3|nr:transporter substrate-binding domain-containing protein [Psychromonas aquimarina]